ncbi:MAG: 16S rRNA (cytosine(1402)-N(4))-methyltransferase RsmH, partial [Rivularia sp. ALOHA_DT_140]|nr:16S rRNA (cytosine(1402)-N(4))-methyltransferase RsmH [Rivularia sp. ALOHA_DT_140]
MSITNQSSQESNLQTPAFSHIPVLGKEIITGLNIKAGGHYLDTTVGGGGHSRLILEAAPNTQITAVDQDEDALIAAKNNLAEFGNRVEFVRSNFAEYNFPKHTFDGIIADLGVSSYHLDNPERGFSFRYEADLDMRMDRRQSLNAAEIINHWDEVELANIFYKYGE